jgi:hypothetical protein
MTEEDEKIFDKLEELEVTDIPEEEMGFTVNMVFLCFRRI